jgi:hypothetical protein
MSRIAKVALVTALTLPALALASCGGEDAKLLPGETAQEITANLDKVRELSDEGDCVGAEGAAREIGEQIGALRGVDQKLQRALEEGAARLNEVIAECEEAEVETTPTTTPEPSEEEAEEKETEKKEKEEQKEEKEREKEEKEREKEEAEEGGREPPSEEGELPPQSNGEGKGLENGKGPSGEGEESVGPSGGVSPGAPAEGD